MTRATLAAILLPFAPALAACSGSDAVMSPSAPSPVTAQAAPSAGLYGPGYTRQGVALFDCDTRFDCNWSARCSSWRAIRTERDVF
jgi:hypothetical protein